jgi:hypothetical protein
MRPAAGRPRRRLALSWSWSSSRGRPHQRRRRSTSRRRPMCARPCRRQPLISDQRAWSAVSVADQQLSLAIRPSLRCREAMGKQPARLDRRSGGTEQAAAHPHGNDKTAARGRGTEKMAASHRCPNRRLQLTPETSGLGIGFFGDFSAAVFSDVLGGGGGGSEAAATPAGVGSFTGSSAFRRADASISSRSGSWTSLVGGWLKISV